MSSNEKKAVQEKQKATNTVAPTMPYEKATIDLTEPDPIGTDEKVESTEPFGYLAVAPSLAKSCNVTEGGISLKKKKRKSGATEIWDGIKKQQTSGKMIDKQMELATKLAEFEEVIDELQVERFETGASHVSRIPEPAEWVKNPWRQSSCDMSAANIENLSLSESEQFAKITKIADCMKYMNIEANPQTLKSWYMDTLKAEASALGVKVVEEPALCYRAVAMSRTMPRELVGDQAQMLKLSHTRKNSMRFLYIMAASDAVELLKKHQLTAHMSARKHILGGQITLLVLDSEKYFKKGKPGADLEVAIIDLLVTLEIDTVVVKSSDELISTVLQYTKAVAEEPAKLAKRAVDEQAEFYMRGDNKNCVTVDQQGNGVSRLWQQMLSVLPQSSLEVSRAVSAAYSSPQALAECVRSGGGVARLADLGVARSAAPDARPRRLGVEFANKLKILFTEEDGDVVVE